MGIVFCKYKICKTKNVVSMGNNECMYTHKTTDSEGSVVYHNVKFKNNVYRDHKFIISNLTVYKRMIIHNKAFNLFSKKGQILSYYIDDNGDIIML